MPGLKLPVPVVDCELNVSNGGKQGRADRMVQSFGDRQAPVEVHVVKGSQ